MLFGLRCDFRQHHQSTCTTTKSLQCVIHCRNFILYAKLTLLLSCTLTLFSYPFPFVVQNSALVSEVLQNLVRLWLGLGSVQHTLQAVEFLLSQCLPKPLPSPSSTAARSGKAGSADSKALPALQLRRVVAEWAAEMDAHLRRRSITGIDTPAFPACNRPKD
jgi:hypothetical protein